MRTIKFRVYTETKPEVLGMKYFDLSNTSERNDTVMQFTGLLDKSGKEIYEGDIVNVLKHYEGDSLYQDEICETKFSDGGFYFTKPGKLGSYFEPYKECEIIGNIYENPELLK